MSAYSFMDVFASLVGPGGDIDLGYGSGAAEEGIDIAMVEDKNTMTVGADGEYMHSLHAGNAATATLRFLKTSPTNNLLITLFNAQKMSSALWGKNMILVRQTASGDLHTCVGCAFKRRTNTGYKKVGDFYEWAFDVGRVESELGRY
jgi:hypothetical protein